MFSLEGTFNNPYIIKKNIFFINLFVLGYANKKLKKFLMINWISTLVIIKISIMILILNLFLFILFYLCYYYILQYFSIEFVNEITVSIRCAICFYGVGLSHIVFAILTMMTAFPHIAIICHIYYINWIINIIECALWVPEFFGYDVSFVDVVKFDYRNFYIKFYVQYSSILLSVLHNKLFIMSVMWINSVWSWQMLLLLGFD